MAKPESGGSRWIPVILVVIFFAPVLGAIWLVQSGWSPSARTNHGELIAPPQAIEPQQLQPVGGAVDGEPLRGTWTLLLLWPGPCGGACRDLLDELARVHLALNKDIDRMTRALVLPTAAEMPALSAPARGYRADAELIRAWASSEQGAVQLADPRGFRMMHYPLPLDASGLLNDLERLLRLSDEEQERRAATEDTVQ